MKILFIASLMLLAACGSRPTVEQLEDEPLISGDWSKVEARERGDARTYRDSMQRCPTGNIAYCETHLDPESCKCVRSNGQDSLPIAE